MGEDRECMSACTTCYNTTNLKHNTCTHHTYTLPHIYTPHTHTHTHTHHTYTPHIHIHHIYTYTHMCTYMMSRQGVYLVVSKAGYIAQVHGNGLQRLSNAHVYKSTACRYL